MNEEQEELYFIENVLMHEEILEVLKEIIYRKDLIERGKEELIEKFF